MHGYWSQRLMNRAPEGAAGAGGSGSGGAGGGSEGGSGGEGGNQQQAQKPAWAAEFGDNFDPERAWETISNLRRVEKQLNRTNTDLSKKVEAFEAAGQTELEKAQAAINTLTEENRLLKESAQRAAVKGQIAELARAAGAHAPDDVYALLDASAIQQDDDGKVTNGQSLINALKQQKAYLFRPGGRVDAGAGRDRTGGAQGEGGSQTDFNRGVRSLFGVTR